MSENCRLCHGSNVGQFAETNQRTYLRCGNCDMVFVTSDQLPDLTSERAEYALHNNDPSDVGYRKHLSRLTDPLVSGLAKTANGLDFGCGPGPTISVMLDEQGYNVANYDPAFFSEKSLLSKKYDFVSCTEVVEHFHQPVRDFEVLAGLLKPGGRLGVMTQLLSPDIDFLTWYYPREISHVAFYSAQTMEWIGRRFDWRVEVLGKNVVLFE